MIKNLILLFFALILTFGCQSEGQGSDQSSTSTSNSSAEVGTPVAPTMSREAQLLVNGYWIFEFYVVPKGVEDHKNKSIANRGRWFNFNEDGTFECGQWQNKQSEGTWRLEAGERFPMIVLNAKDPQYNAMWEIQGISPENDMMTWSGVQDSGLGGIITKTIMLSSMPQKEQFKNLYGDI